MTKEIYGVDALVEGQETYRLRLLVFLTVYSKMGGSLGLNGELGVSVCTGLFRQW